MRRKFEIWCSSQWSQSLVGGQLTPKLLPFVNSAQATVPNMTAAFPTPEHMSRAESMLETHHLHSGSSGGGIGGVVGQSHHNLIVHPALQTVHSQYPSQKTRMRTSFDPEMELPKLQHWFHENPHPTRQQIQSFVIQLNSLESRRGRKPLDVNNVVYWFKNARAAQKRAEIRGQSLANGFGSTSSLMMAHASYLKSPLSVPCSEDNDNLSQHSDDLDDDMMGPPSPQAPLSLTTHERNRSASPQPNDGHRHALSSLSLSTLKQEQEETEMNNNDGPPSTKIHHNGSDMNSSGSGLEVQTGDGLKAEQRPRTLSEKGTNNGNSGDDHSPPPNSPKSEDLDLEDSDMMNSMSDFRSPSPDSRRDMSFPIVPNPMLSQLYMRHHYMPQMEQNAAAAAAAAAANLRPQQCLSPNLLVGGGMNLSSMSNDERRKRNRTFIDPVTEVPKLEQWFGMNTHPSHNLILKYTEDLNRMPYRWVQLSCRGIGHS